MSSPLQLVAPTAFHVMTKPIGPICNLDCKYCFYLEKEKLYGDKSSWRMSDEVLETYIRGYIDSQPGTEISFAWQGGEPTLMGVKFFQRVVELQQKYCPPGRRISNAVQTNGTLLDDDWCRLFHDHNFLIGLSIDGPADLHDHYRVDKGGRPTFDRVMAGLELLKKHKVEFNTLTVVHRQNARRPLDVYRFLKKIGSGYMQFIPLVERVGPADGVLAEPPLLRVLNGTSGGEESVGVSGYRGIGATLADTPTLRYPDTSSSHPNTLPSSPPVTPWTVIPEDFGNFLCGIFDEWVRNDIGRIFVQLFDVQLGIWMGMPSALCVFSEKCGTAMALEHNGDLYACDHFVYPRWKLGNIMDRPMTELAFSPEQRQFGSDKQDKLPKYCQQCDVRFACNGECPKHRFAKTPDGEDGLNYLCAGYKKFFHHVDPYMQAMARLLRSRRPAAEIMAIIADREHSEKQAAAWQTAGRNDPCPCGSGKKFKKCCWEKRDAVTQGAPDGM